MSIGTFDTAVLTRFVRQIEDPPFFFTNGVAQGFDGFFPMIQEEDTEEIHFDFELVSRRVTPFVSPIRSGRVFEREGYRTDSFKPAYAKDKRVFEPDQPLKRLPGEALGGQLSPGERRRANVARALGNMRQDLGRRLEAMAAEVLRTGQVTVQGDGFDAVVDFNRDASLDVTETGADMWSDTGTEVVGKLEDYAQLMVDAEGGAPTDVVMASNVWRVARSKSDVQDALNRDFAQQSNLELGPLAGKVRMLGTLGDFRLWVYTMGYTDQAGASQKFVPDDWVYMVNAGDLEGTRAYGVIKDEDADFDAMRFFSKSWTKEDPSVRYLLLQSAPLVVPYRPNASLAANVINN